MRLQKAQNSQESISEMEKLGVGLCDPYGPFQLTWEILRVCRILQFHLLTGSLADKNPTVFKTHSLRHLF